MATARFRNQVTVCDTWYGLVFWHERIAATDG